MPQMRRGRYGHLDGIKPSSLYRPCLKCPARSGGCCACGSLFAGTVVIAIMPLDHRTGIPPTATTDPVAPILVVAASNMKPTMSDTHIPIIVSTA